MDGTGVKMRVVRSYERGCKVMSIKVNDPYDSVGGTLSNFHEKVTLFANSFISVASSFTLRDAMCTNGSMDGTPAETTAGEEKDQRALYNAIRT